MKEDRLEGGCLCGRVRYRIAGRRVDAGWCHCRLCQKSTGAPAVAWGTWPNEALSWMKGRPAVFKSSVKGRRLFCPDCGTQLAFRPAPDSRTLDVSLASLDEPAAVTPDYHVWTSSQVCWVRLVDDLPRYEDEGPDTSD